MKAILEFNLPEEQEEFKLANEGSACKSALWDINMYFRNQIKYESLSDKENDLYTKIWLEITDIIQAHDITLD